MDFTFSTQLHYLIHHVDGDYVAHCLDMDLVGVGATPDESVAALNTAVRGLIFLAIRTESFDSLNLSKKAPVRYWTLFEEALQTSGSTICKLEISPELAPVEVTQCHFTYCMAVAA